MSKIYRLSPYVCFEVTDETTSIELGQNPSLYLYKFDNPVNIFEVFRADGTTESRINGFSARHDNTLLSPTPSFYYDALGNVVGGYHNSRRITSVIASTLTSLMQYRNGRILFADGFAYDAETTIGTTLRIFAQYPDRTVDLLQFVDFFDDTKILATSPVLYEGQTFSSQIPLQWLDVEYIHQSVAPDVVEIKNYLFPSKPQMLFVEMSSISPDDLVDYVYNATHFKKINMAAVSRHQIDLTASVLDLYSKVELKDGTISVSVGSVAYDPESYIKRMYMVNDEEPTVFHNITTTSYDSNNVIIDTNSTRLMNVLDSFAPVRNRPLVALLADHVVVDVSSVVGCSNGVRIERKATRIITEPNAYKIGVHDPAVPIINITSDIIYNQIVTTTNTIKQDSTTPKAIIINRNVYIQLEPIVGEITLSPFNQTVSIKTGITNPTGESVLNIGTNKYYSVDGFTFTYSIPQTAYNTKETEYFITTIDGNLITRGVIKK